MLFVVEEDEIRSGMKDSPGCVMLSVESVVSTQNSCRSKSRESGDKVSWLCGLNSSDRFFRPNIPPFLILIVELRCVLPLESMLCSMPKELAPLSEPI